MTRLIDADKLKETLSNNEAIRIFNLHYDGLIAEIIDNAPTVDVTALCPVDFPNDDDPYPCCSYKRPIGEWEKPFEMNGKSYHKCTNCHISSELILIDKYCPNCGAKMKKGGAECLNLQSFTRKK